MEGSETISSRIFCINQFSIVGLGAGTSSPSSQANGRIAMNIKKMTATAITSHFHSFFFSFRSIDSPKVRLCGYFRLRKVNFSYSCLKRPQKLRVLPEFYQFCAGGFRLLLLQLSFSLLSFLRGPSSRALSSRSSSLLRLFLSMQGPSWAHRPEEPIPLWQKTS